MPYLPPWNNPRAVKYRQLYEIKGLLGMAVNVQAMVFGNMGNHPATGRMFYKESFQRAQRVIFMANLINAQGEDVVAGIRTPEPIENLRDMMPEAYPSFVSIRIFEKHFKDDG